MELALSKPSIPVRMKVSRMMIVEKGDRVGMRVDEVNTGYINKFVEADGLYIGPDHPIITLEEIELFLSELRRLRDKRRREKDEALEKKMATSFNAPNDCRCVFSEEDDD